MGWKRQPSKWYNLLHHKSDKDIGWIRLMKKLYRQKNDQRRKDNVQNAELAAIRHANQSCAYIDAVFVPSAMQERVWNMQLSTVSVPADRNALSDYPRVETSIGEYQEYKLSPDHDHWKEILVVEI